MFHPLLRLLASHPDLVAEHLTAYAALAQAEAVQTGRGLRQRALLGTCAFFGLLLAIGLAGVALLFVAALPLSDMPRPWLLWVVPVVPLIASLLCAMRASRLPPVNTLVRLRGQWQADLQLLRVASARGKAA